MKNAGLTKDARGLVSEVVTYLRRDGSVSGVLPKVETLLARVTSQAKREKTAKVETGVALTEAEKKSLAKALERHVGHEMEIENIISAGVIGGLRIRVGDWVVDTTVVSRLTELAQSLGL